MEVGSVGAEIRAETFSNGLEITASHVQLGDQTWAVGQIKEVEIGPAASGIGMIVCGLLLLFFIMVLFAALIDGSAGAAIGLLFMSIACGYGVYASWIGVNSEQVWLKTGIIPAVIFRSTDKAEARRVKTLLERAIAQQTPAT